jgi:uncharacterized RDD family membrane protein YckC
VTNPPSPTGGDEDESSLTGMLGRAGAAAMRPVRRVANAGRDALTDEAERALDGVMAGPLPEALGRSIVEHHVLERVVASALETRKAASTTEAPSVDLDQIELLVRQTLENPAVERTLKEAIDSRVTAELADQITQSAAFQRSLRNVLSSPEVRHALQRQTAGFGSDIAAAARRKARGADASVESPIRSLIRRPRPDVQRETYGGLVTRGFGFVIDALLTQLVYLVAGGMIGLVTSIFGTLRPTWLVGTLAGIGGILVVTLYFVVFWTFAGQTPGMRIMRVRLLHAGQAPSLWRSCLRLVGLVVAVIPCFAGFLPVLFDPRRRALPDYLAGTTVVYEPEPAEAELV